VAGARWLRSIRARRALRGPAAWPMRAAKAAWKLARRLPLTDRIEVELPVDGHRMRVRLFSYDDLLTIAEEYETCLGQHLPPQGGMAVDAGAYIGRHTLAYARAVGPAGRVIAVEPLPANFRLLQHNVRRNGYQQLVHCAACALGRAAGQVRLGYDKETSIASAYGEFPLHLTVEQRSLDDLLSEQGIAQIDFLRRGVGPAGGKPASARRQPAGTAGRRNSRPPRHDRRLPRASLAARARLFHRSVARGAAAVLLGHENALVVCSSSPYQWLHLLRSIVTRSVSEAVPRLRFGLL